MKSVITPELIPATKFVLASNNKNKIAELEAILSAALPGARVLSLRDIGYTDDIEENGASFEENSYIKARVPASLGYIGIGDDSGLCVDALDGRPGIFSARYSGGDDEGNIDKLLGELVGVSNRRARFVCVITCVFPSEEKIVCRAQTEGEILTQRRGDGGFGYDSVFYYPPLLRTFAQLRAEEKNRISHRAKALSSLASQLGAKNTLNPGGVCTT